jgi:FKBP-type peptidyl-prolyl cis-trans isomerase 2
MDGRRLRLRGTNTISREESMKMKSNAESGDQVTLHLTGKTRDEEVFATTVGEQPIELTIGEGLVIPGVENGIIGMQVGEKRTFTLSPQEGFGERRDELVPTVKKEDFPDSIQPSIGQQLRVRVKDDKVTKVSVTHIKKNEVTLDGNHPLAGQVIKFEIELLDIR